MALLLHQLRSASPTALIALAQAEAGDDTAPMNEIIRRFEPLIRRLARGMTASRPDLYDDVANACRAGLVRAVRRHNSARAGFPAYAEKFMRGAALRELAKWQREDERMRLTPMDEESDTAAVENFEDRLTDDLAPWGDGAVAEAIAKLSPSQQKIVTLRYVYDAPLDLIASNSGTSVSAVSQRLTTIHRKVETALAA